MPNVRHDNLLHPGREKTLDRVRRHFWWPAMTKDIALHVKGCDSCRKNGARGPQPHGQLKGLPFQGQRFETVHVDWVTDLPTTSLGYDQVMVVVDRISKFAYFVPAKKTDTAEEATDRLYSTVFCVHGPPKQIISDRDTKFTSAFFKRITAMHGVTHMMGTAHRHNYNGAVEVVNKTFEVMLRHVLSGHEEDDFDTWLPFAAYAYNTAAHKALGGLTPFYALFGYTPRHPSDWVIEGQEEITDVTSMGARQQQLLGEVIDALCASQRLMELYENQGRRSGDIIQGDYVYLSTANLGNSHFKQKCRKLRERYQGPFRVTKKVADHIFRLQLPEKDFSRIHPEFHQSLLWKTLPQEEGKEEMGEQLDEGVPVIGPVESDVYLVEEIMDFRKGKGYLVRWTGYRPGRIRLDVAKG